MKKKEKENKEKEQEEVDRHAENIPSKQDRSWVSEKQMPQKQFDKTEFENEQEKEKLKGKKKCDE